MTDLSPDDELDARLVERAIGGDGTAYADLVRRHQARALRVAFVICGSVSEAEDAVQDAFVKAHAALRSVRRDAPVRPWLMRIVANTARNAVRSRSRRQRVWTRQAAQRATSPPTPEDEVLASVRDRDLWAALAQLGERDRRVLGLRFFGGLSESETAAALEVPVGTVKSRSARALARLHDLLQEGSRE